MNEISESLYGGFEVAEPIELNIRHRSGVGWGMGLNLMIAEL